MDPGGEGERLVVGEEEAYLERKGREKRGERLAQSCPASGSQLHQAKGKLEWGSGGDLCSWDCVLFLPPILYTAEIVW